MIYKINTNDCKQGMLTYKFDGLKGTISMILPTHMPLVVGDAIAEVRFFRQVENKALCLRVDAITEERPSKGIWSLDTPIWRKLNVTMHPYTADELNGIARVMSDNDGKEKLYL